MASLFWRVPLILHQPGFLSPGLTLGHEPLITYFGIGPLLQTIDIHCLVILGSSLMAHPICIVLADIPMPAQWSYWNSLAMFHDVPMCKQHIQCLTWCSNVFLRFCNMLLLVFIGFHNSMAGKNPPFTYIIFPLRPSFTAANYYLNNRLIWSSTYSSCRISQETCIDYSKVTSLLYPH